MVKHKEKIYYIYIDRTADDGTPFYVGKGLSGRVSDFKKRNVVWQRIAKKYGYIREIIFGTKDEEFALKEEIRLIDEYKTYRRNGQRTTHWGANLTVGGDGVSGYFHSKERLLKIKESSTGHNNAMYGRKHSKETIEKLSGHNHFLFGKTRSIEARKKQSVSQTGERNPRAKLSLIQVNEIKDKWATGEYSQVKLAKEYGVGRTCIGQIVRGQGWKI